MIIACIQPKIHQSIKKCYSEIEYLLKMLIDQVAKIDIICLPERWVPLLNDISQNIQKERGENYSFIKTIAGEYQINIISGAIWEKRKNSRKPTITSYFINEKGEEVGRQDKIHLYSYEKGQFEPGNELNLFSFNEYFFAILICFDMAFFETPRLAAENGADVLFSPTQIREEGMYNWKIYLQARALENRIPIIACNSVGSFNKRRFLGNSKIISFVKNFISPSKLKIVEGPKDSGYIFDDIDLKFPKKIRKIRFNEKIEKNNIKINVINK
ncbi:MAG: carbon-nitrogen hydrolase family protein [Promethearchaeota archaeon]|nr:MAG: carbon-nitrogen hydrolase family protein [Candidatus Lokiarchaeota archaeon]